MKHPFKFQVQTICSEVGGRVARRPNTGSDTPQHEAASLQLSAGCYCQDGAAGVIYEL